MPLLDFICTKCGKKFDEFTRIASIPEVKCPSCKGDTRRIYEGKCYGRVGNSGGASCSGDCSGCSGCGQHN